MTRAIRAAIVMNLLATGLSAQQQDTYELARELIEARHFQTKIDRLVFLSKHQALLPFTGSDLRPDQIEIIRSITVDEWSTARNDVVKLYVEAFAQSYSEDALKKLIAFYSDVELQTALAMEASAETRVIEAHKSLSPRVKARIKTRMTTELSD